LLRSLFPPSVAHYVQAGSGKDKSKNTVTVDGVEGTVTRSTFAFFLQPDTFAPVGRKEDGSVETFGEFSKRIMESHY
jgi:hypothetical protein